MSYFYWGGELIIGDVDWSGYVEEASLSMSRNVAELKPIGGSAVGRVGGRLDGQLQVSGAPLEIATTDPDAWSMFGSGEELPFCLTPDAGSQVGDYAYYGKLINGEQSRTAGDDVIRIPMAFQGAQDIGRGRVLKELSEITAAGSRSDVSSSSSASSSSGAKVYLFVTALVGTLSVTVKHGEVTGDTTLVEMTELTDTTGYEVKAVSGTVERYTKVQWTLTGEDAAATFAVGIVRG